MAAKDRTVEEILGSLASRSHGVVTRQEVLGSGVTRDELEHRVAIGTLIRVHRGVFCVGHRPPSVEARWCGIPITTVQRTLVDLAAVLEEDELARGVHEADGLRSPA